MPRKTYAVVTSTALVKAHLGMVLATFAAPAVGIMEYALVDGKDNVVPEKRSATSRVFIAQIF